MAWLFKINTESKRDHGLRRSMQSCEDICLDFMEELNISKNSKTIIVHR